MRQALFLFRADFRYLRPALYDDELTITTVISEVKGPRLFFEYTIENERKELVAKAKTTLVFVAKSTMRPIAPPDSFVALIQHYYVEE